VRLEANDDEVSSGKWKLSPPRCGERQRPGNQMPSHLDHHSSGISHTLLRQTFSVVKDRRSCLVLRVAVLWVLECSLEEDP